MAGEDGTSLRFLGAAGTVTGSRFLVESGSARILVDCGLYQGLKDLRRRNWERFPVPPESIDAVVVSHAHIDHSGYLPALHRHGFRGKVFASRGTTDLCEIVLRDSGRLQEEEAEYANRHHTSKHEPALPLYTEEDAAAVLGCFAPVPFHQEVQVADGIRARLEPAGHILGSATVSLACADGARLGFSGDLGRPNHPILRAPRPLDPVDVLLVESTYGDRAHEGLEAVDSFARTIARTAGRGGVVVIPAFAVDRTEVVLYALRRLVEAKRIPAVPVYVDSPMAIAALHAYRKAIAEGSEEIRPELAASGGIFDPGDLIEARSVEESKEIKNVEGPAIIVSASGMATGGRVLHHLLQRLPDARNTVILVGYQAQGTRGRRLLEGERALKMYGRYVPVRAEVENVAAFSVHVDRGEMLAWLESFPKEPSMTFVVHGEPESSHSLAQAVGSELGWPAVVPKLGERVRVEPGGSG